MLLVEKAARVRLVMRRALEGCGYSVVEAPNEQDVLKLVVRQRVELQPWASYLQKPLMPEELAPRVREVLDQDSSQS